MKRLLLTLYLLLSIACASAPARPAPPPVTPTTAVGAVGITVTPPMAGITVHVGPTSCVTDERGIAYCVPVPVGEYILTFDGIDATAWEPAGGNDQLTVNVPAGNVEVVAPFTALHAAGHEHGFLHVCGTDFCDEDGKPWLFAGYANYVPIAAIAKGEDLGPIFDEAAGYGANTLVALGMDLGDWATANGFRVDPRDPQWATWLATLFDTAAQRHMRVALGVFQQAQALSLAEQRAVWETAVKVARGRWNVILRLGNEDDVNGWRHADFSKPGDLGGVLVSTGSRGINNPPVPPNWDWAEWESRREPLHKAMDDAGAGVLEQHAGYPGFPAYPGPIVVIEPPFFNDTTPDLYGDTRWTDPKLALQLGLEIGANAAGGTFGSSLGLVGRPNGSGAAECARQFFRGLKAGFQR